jgi:hypothetical protein
MWFTDLPKVTIHWYHCDWLLSINSFISNMINNDWEYHVWWLYIAVLICVLMELWTYSWGLMLMTGCQTTTGKKLVILNGGCRNWFMNITYNIRIYRLIFSHQEQSHGIINHTMSRLYQWHYCCTLLIT